MGKTEKEDMATEMLDAEQKQAEQEKDDSKEFDKERQRADQAEANFRKIQAERDQMSDKMTQLQQQFEQQQAQLAELNAQSQANQSIADSLPDIDVEEATIEDIAKVVLQSKKIIADQAKELASLKTKATRYEEESAKERQERIEQERRNKILNEVCTDFEEEFGAGLRNDAIKLMEEKTAAEGLPANSAQAVLRLRKCFKEVSDKRSKGSKGSKGRKQPIVDPGGGGGERPSFEAPQIKKGSLDEVANQYAKATGG